MKALIWLKQANLALLGILVQLVQKLNQNVSVKHPIPKMNLIKTQQKTKISFKKNVSSDLVTKLVNLFIFVKILWKISSHWWFQKKGVTDLTSAQTSKVCFNGFYKKNICP